MSASGTKRTFEVTLVTARTGAAKYIMLRPILSECRKARTDRRWIAWG